MNNEQNRDDGYLSGQLLIAMPSMRDERFAGSVILLCAHSDEGAMGLILNQNAVDVTFEELVDQLELSEKPDLTVQQLPDIPVHIGGPVESQRGFVLHSNDFHADDDTLNIDDTVSLTATLDILRAIAAGDGPQDVLLALGYAGWAPGQLENEIQSNGWLSCKADREIIFKAGIDDRYTMALSRLGVDPAFLVADTGHA